MRKKDLSATQKAAVEKIKVLIKEYALASKPSFLYTRGEVLKIMEKDLSKLDAEYIKKYEIPDDIVKGLAKEVYDTLMEKGDHDRAIAVAEHYGL